ncbi:hypothetical protein HHUSO_G20881 [Huso huso]|uniref:Uncharacterized protein n=1 Tax=Huso huso TaxID=61971 RepID=A0ABR0Z1F8_HUSHU
MATTSMKSGLELFLSEDERFQIGECFQASLAGVMELDVLKSRHRKMVEAALGRMGKHQTRSQNRNFSARLTGSGQRQQQHQTQNLEQLCMDGLQEGVPSLKLALSQSQDVLGCSEKSRLKTARFTPLSEHLERHNKSSTHAAPGISTIAFLKDNPGNQSHSDSRTSSGFYEESDSTSVYSESLSGSDWSIHSLSHQYTTRSANCLSELRLQLLPGSGGRAVNSSPATDPRRPFSTGDLQLLRGLLSIADLCPQSYRGTILVLQPELGLNLKYQSDLISRDASEVYEYPSPLHAVALQNTQYATDGISQSSSCRSSREDLSEDSDSSNTTLKSDAPALTQLGYIDTTRSNSRPNSVGSVGPTPFSQLCKLDKYISKLVLKYRCRSVAAPLNAGIREQEQLLSAHHKSLSLSSITAAGSTAVNSGFRRQISTCCLVRSLNSSSEGFQNSQIWHDSSSSGRNSATSYYSDDPETNSRKDTYKRNKLFYPASSLRLNEMENWKEEEEELWSCFPQRYSDTYRGLVKSSTLNCGHDSFPTESQSHFTCEDMSGSKKELPSVNKKRQGFRKRLGAMISGGTAGKSHSRSEMHLDSIRPERSNQLFRSESQNILDDHTPRIHEKQKWMSVLEVSSSDHSKGAAVSPWEHSNHLHQLHHKQGRPKRGTARFHSTFSSDSLSGLCSSQGDLVSDDLFYGTQSSLSSEIKTVSSFSGDLEGSQSPLGCRGPRDSEPRLYRTMSFRKLRKRMLKSIWKFSFNHL